MRVFNIVFCVLFIVFAVLQYDDPDPYVWIPMYLYGAFLCGQAAKKKYNPSLYVLGFLVYAGYAVYLFFDKTGVWSWAREHDAENIAQTMKATKPWIEATREFGGLLILIIVLLINTVYFRRKRAKSVLKTA